MRVIEIDKNICTGCQECTKVCPAYAIEGNYHEPQTINTDRCIMCGQCVQKCKAYVSVWQDGEEAYEKVRKERNLPEGVKEPLFAAHNICHLDKVREAIRNKELVTMVQCAPAIHVAIAEEFGHAFGTSGEKKLAAALRAVGFDYIYDTNFAADLTIMEEGTELISRIKNNGVLPMFTSCCPAWVKYVENCFPEFKENLSTCKSPQQMQGAVMKTYGAKVHGISPEKIFSVSVMPCTCKEFECEREEMKSSGYQDVDVVLTTRELAWLLKEEKVDFDALPEEEYDAPFGNYSGAGMIFGVTGGVMEAALRTGYELLTKQPIEQIEILSVRGSEGFRQSEIKVGDMVLRVGVITGVQRVYEVMDQVRKGKLKLDFIEVMTCPEGCISGGGQPKLLMDVERKEAYEARKNAIYHCDENLPVRKSHENPDIRKLYEEFLGEPNSEKAHQLLHVHH